jgi:aminoglycoside phosphotransferase (APT) family kinase protein
MTDVRTADPQAELIDTSRLIPLGQGRTAEIFRYGDNRVVKLFRPSFPRQAIENEYRVCCAIGAVVNIPKAHGRVVIDGRDAIVFDFVEGVSGFRYLLQTPWRLKAFAFEFAAIHARIHAMSVSDEMPELTTILVRNINLHDLLRRETKDSIVSYLHGLPGGISLCHGDYHPDNLMLRGTTPFVLDWMTASRGNALADVARTGVLLKWAEPGPGTPTPVKALLAVIRRKFTTHYFSHYTEITGTRMEDIEQWELPVLAARLMEWIPQSEKEHILSIITEKMNHR